MHPGRCVGTQGVLELSSSDLTLNTVSSRGVRERQENFQTGCRTASLEDASLVILKQDAS